MTKIQQGVVEFIHATFLKLADITSCFGDHTDRCGPNPAPSEQEFEPSCPVRVHEQVH